MKYNFEITDMEIVEENSNSQFATVEVDVCRTGDNSHRLFISEDSLRNSALSVKGKPILVELNREKNDFLGHEATEYVCGFFEETDPIFVERDGETYLRARGKIWKQYFQNVMDVFKRKNGKTEVSMEVQMIKGKEPTTFTEGSMDLFAITGCTLLGVAPSIKGSEARVLSFSEIKEEYNKENDSVEELTKFLQRRKEDLADKDKYVSHPINTSKDAMYDGEWDGNKAKQDLVKEKNYASLASKVCLRLEDGWRDREVTKLGYPVMGLHNGEWVYFRKGLSSALSYAKGENDTEIVNKVQALYKKLGLDDEGKGEDKKMSDEKFSEQHQEGIDVFVRKFGELEGRELYGEVIKRVHKKLGDHYYIVSVEDNKVRVKNTQTKEMWDIPAKIKLGKDDEHMSIDIDYDKMKKSSDQKEFEEEDKYPEDDDHSTNEKDKEEVEDDDEDNEKEMKKKQKDMSLDAHADISAYYEMLIHETEQYRDLAKRLLESEGEDRGLVMKECLEMAKELDGLREYKCAKEDEEKTFEVNKVLAEVKVDLSEKDFADLQEEGMACKYEEIQMFKTKVKARAYESSKNKRHEENKDDENKEKQFAKMGFDFEAHLNKNTQSAEEIFGKYLNK